LLLPECRQATRHRWRLWRRSWTPPCPGDTSICLGPWRPAGFGIPVDHINPAVMRMKHRVASLNTPWSPIDLLSPLRPLPPPSPPASSLPSLPCCPSQPSNRGCPFPLPLLPALFVASSLATAERRTCATTIRCSTRTRSRSSSAVKSANIRYGHGDAREYHKDAENIRRLWGRRPGICPDGTSPTSSYPRRSTERNQPTPLGR
jgi:hypothetical protein